MATPMHETVADFAALLKESVLETGAIDRCDLAKLKISEFAGEYTGM